jgi:hypothetical protein
MENGEWRMENGCWALGDADRGQAWWTAGRGGVDTNFFSWKRLSTLPPWETLCCRSGESGSGDGPGRGWGAIQSSCAKQLSHPTPRNGESRAENRESGTGYWVLVALCL